MRCQENIKFYAGIPLLNRRETIGVLEVCSTQPFSPDPEWVNFLKMIAGQTTIAIVHITLFHHIRGLNAELLNSYENTLEGWARALELKDHETKGHSDRVTQMAVKLGKVMGLKGKQIPLAARIVMVIDVWDALPFDRPY